MIARVTRPQRRADEPERRLIARTWRRIAVQTAALFTVGILVLGALAALLVLRVQRADTNRLLGQAVAADADESPPAGTWIYRWEPDNGRFVSSPGAPTRPPDPAGLAAVAGGAPARTVEVSQDGREVLVRTQRRGDRVVQAALDLSYQERERHRLYLGLLVAAGAGAALSVLVGTLIARRAIQPLGVALARQRRFVADASHESRTPLTQLHTRAQLLDRQIRNGADPATVAADSQQLVRGTRELGELVEELLLAAQLRAEPARSQPVDLARIATEVVAAEAERAQRSGIELTVAAGTGATGTVAAGTTTGTAVPDAADDGVSGAGGCVVSGSPPALRRVVTSLVDNALGHTSAGGHVRVLLRREPDGAVITLRVSDDGVGFDPADAQRLFERFARGRIGDGRRFGLGLALVREVVDAHGGTVTALGEPGRGATFTVRLPALSAR